jgi:RHS repeat-associated protein
MEQINDTTGTALFLDHDAQGSTRVITDASGTVKGRVNYDAYGNVTFQGGTPTAFGYQGQYTDAESGLVTMGGTFYDPATGQSLTAARRLPGRTNWANIQLSRGSLADPSTQRFVKILAAPLAEVRQNIEELHADLFIDSCSDSRAAANFDATSTWTRCPTFEPPVDIFLSPYGLPGGDPVSTASPWRYIAVRRTAM